MRRSRGIYGVPAIWIALSITGTPASQADGFDDAGSFGTVPLPCQEPGGASCGGILRGCDDVKTETLSKVAPRYTLKIKGIYDGSVFSLFGDREANNQDPPPDPPVEVSLPWATPVCDLLLGETTNPRPDSCSTACSYDCGRLALSRFKVISHSISVDVDWSDTVIPYPEGFSVSGNVNAKVTTYCQTCTDRAYPSGTQRGIREMAWTRGAYPRAYKCAFQQVKSEINAGQVRVTAESCKDMADEIRSQYEGLVANVTHGDGSTTSHSSLCAHQGVDLTNVCAGEDKIAEGASGGTLMVDLDLADGMRQKFCYLGAYRQGIEAQLGYLTMCEVTHRAELLYFVVSNSFFEIAAEVQDQAQGICDARARDTCPEPSDWDVGTAWVDGSLDELIESKENCVNDVLDSCYPPIVEQIMRTRMNTLFDQYFPGVDCEKMPESTAVPVAGEPVPAGVPFGVAVLLLIVVASVAGAGAGCSPGIVALPNNPTGPSAPTGGTGGTGGPTGPPAPVVPPTVDDPADIQEENRKQAEVNETTSELADAFDIEEGGATEGVADGNAVRAGASTVEGGITKGDGDESARTGSRGGASDNAGSSGGGGGGGGAAGRSPTSAGLGSVSTSPAQTGGTGPTDAEQEVEDAIYEGGGGAGYAGREGGGAAGVEAPGDGIPGEMDFGAAAQAEQEVDPLLGEDPQNYFGLIGSIESLFERITRRYEKKQRQWDIATAESKLKASERKARRRN